MFSRRWILAACVAAGIPMLAPWGALAEATRVTFLHTNDVYEISPKRGQGGLPQLMTLIKAERAAAQHAITTFGGDLISPSVMSGLTEGAQMIELMNAIGVDVAVPGNHEFDFGPEIAARRIAEANFPWLGTNVLDADGKPATGLRAFHTVQAGDFTVGFFGLLTPDTKDLSSPGEAIRFAPVVETATKAVQSLKEAGADLVVALTHLEIADDRALARSVKGLNMILGGHDHDPITFYEGGVLIHKSGYDAHYLGVIDVSLEWVEQRGKRRLRVRPAWRMLSTAGVAPDADIQRLADAHNARLDKALDVVIGSTKVELDSRRASVRTGEANIGNLIAEAMLAGVGAEVALANGGGIRGDRTYPAGAKLTRKDVLTELPFGNVTVLLAITGADLLAALENGVSKVEDKAGRFPQVAGMRFVYEPAAAKGSRIVEVTVGGNPLDKGRVYKLATNDYIANGGDGYAALKKAKVLLDASGATLLATTVMNHIAAKGEIAPAVDGRIKTK